MRQTGLVEADLKWLAPRLAAARQEVLDDLALYQRGGPVPEEMQPLDAAFFDLPERLLDEDRPLLDRIVAAGDRLAKEVDRVLVLGIGGSYMGARALFEACCHPYHNEISRQRRGGRPRIYFEGNNVDNDAVQGLLDLVEGERRLGHHRHQQERRHAGNGRRLPHLPRRPAKSRAAATWKSSAAA